MVMQYVIVNLVTASFHVGPIAECLQAVAKNSQVCLRCDMSPRVITL